MMMSNRLPLTRRNRGRLMIPFKLIQPLQRDHRQRSRVKCGADDAQLSGGSKIVDAINKLHSAAPADRTDSLR